MTDREFHMAGAVALAEEAAAAGEVPVGCVITNQEGEIIGRGRNCREETGDASAHAEMLAIREACRAMGDWRLDGCTLYVTLEPCPMCAGAILQARIPQVIFGARDPKGGAMGGVLDLFWENFNHRPAVIAGVMERECTELLKKFFMEKRLGKKI